MRKNQKSKIGNFGNKTKVQIILNCLQYDFERIIVGSKKETMFFDNISLVKEKRYVKIVKKLMKKIENIKLFRIK